MKCSSCGEKLEKDCITCPACGVNLKEAYNIEQLEANLKQRGYKLVKITHMKNRDNVTFENDRIRITAKLKKKIKDLNAPNLVRACLGEYAAIFYV